MKIPFLVTLIIFFFTIHVLDPDEVVKKCVSQLMKGYDQVMGGFSRAPKFPQPVNINFLFRYYAIAGKNDDYAKQGLKMVLHTLDMMAKGNKSTIQMEVKKA